jgi:hypothetical protein
MNGDDLLKIHKTKHPKPGISPFTQTVYAKQKRRKNTEIKKILLFLTPLYSIMKENNITEIAAERRTICENCIF